MGALTTRLIAGRLDRFILIVILLIAAAPLRAQDEGQRVDRVEIEGLVSDTPARILPRLNVQPGRTYSPADSTADILILGEIMSMASVRTEPSSGGGIVVIYTVKESPRFHDIQTLGNNRLSTTQIKKLAKLKEGDPLSDRVQQSFQQALRDKYRELGMPQAEIKINRIDLPPDPKAKTPAPQADLQVIVSEGRQVQVKDLVIEGNNSFTSVRLRMHMETKGSWGFIKNYYDEKTFEDDIAKLKEFYKQHGYFQVQVTRGLFKEETRGTVATVSPVIRINEGQRYKLGKVVVRGARLFSQSDVTAPFASLEGKYYEEGVFDAACRQLVALYQDHGLLTTKFEPEYSYDDKNHTISVNIKVDEQERIYVGKISVVRPSYEEEEKPSRFRRWYNRFSPPVREETILREVLLKPGDVWSRRLEQDTIRHLAALGIFEAGNDENGAPKLRINPPIATSEPGVCDMEIQAIEATTGQIGGGVGVGDVTGPFIFGSFTDKNVGGEANVLSIQALLGTRDSSLVFSFLDRHLGNSDNTMQYRAYLQNQILPGYRARVIGTSAEYGHPLTPNWWMYVRPRLEFVSLSPRRNSHGDHDRTDEDLDRSYAVATGRFRVVQDTRWPAQGRPSEGYQQAYSVEAGYAGGPLVRLEAMRDQYFPINSTGSVTYRMLAFGGLMPFDRSVVPIHERYFLGGDTDMRGFRYRGAGYFDNRDKDVPIGGAAKLLIKNEIAYPIYNQISGVVFADVGTLGKSPVSYQVPRLSTGVGVRFDMERVQVALDFAIPVLKQSNDQTRFFHFSLQGEL